MTNGNNNPNDPTPEDPSQDREVVRMILIGSPFGVNAMIRILYTLRFAQISEWSRLLPARKPGKVMSILTRYITKNNR